MKIWDQAWVELLIKEDLIILDYLRYVDDSRDFLKPKGKGKMEW